MSLRIAALIVACGLGPFLAWSLATAQLPDATQPEAQSTPHESPLKTLDWLVGQWSAPAADGSLQFNCHFTKNDAFLIRSFTSTTAAQPALSGMQIIGWDPTKNSIRSWTYDTQGGFGEEVWTQNGNRYTLRVSYTLADGAKASMLNVATFIDNDHFTWKSVQREIDGEPQPDVEELIFTRETTTDSPTGVK